MKKILYVLGLALVVAVGVFVAKSFFSGVKDGYDQAHAEHKLEQEKEKTAVEKPTIEKQEEVSVVEKKDDYSPAIWKIEHAGKTSYLFGSIHVGEDSMYPLPKKIMDAFEASEVLVVEADINKIDQMKMATMIQQLALDLENPLPTVLSEKTKVEYDEFCEVKANICSMVRVFEPWMAAMTIEAMGVMESGYSEELGIDKYFLKSAEDKMVVELESIEGQLNMLDQMPKELQDFMVLGAVSKEEGDTELLMESWRTGKLEEFMEVAEEKSKLLGVSDDVAAQFNEIFLFKRNRVMANGIAELIKEGKSVFAVVGAAHYAGENSVNQYLEEKGYKVERL